MIPTDFKSKLPKFVSYPIGAEALSAGLAGAPYVDSFSLQFVGPSLCFQRIVVERLPCTIFSAKYNPSHKMGQRGCGFVDEEWVIAVFPVLRELRHLANCLLREQGLAWVVEWLRSSHEPGWLEQEHRIELIFNPTEESITKQTISGVVRYTK